MVLITANCVSRYPLSSGEVLDDVLGLSLSAVATDKVDVSTILRPAITHVTSAEDSCDTFTLEVVVSVIQDILPLRNRAEVDVGDEAELAFSRHKLRQVGLIGIPRRAFREPIPFVVLAELKVWSFNTKVADSFLEVRRRQSSFLAKLLEVKA